MSSMVPALAAPFVDRRNYEAAPARMQAASGGNSPTATTTSRPTRELAVAIDRYKLLHRRRYITYEEIMGVVKQLGYEKRGNCCGKPA